MTVWKFRKLPMPKTSSIRRQAGRQADRYRPVFSIAQRTHVKTIR